MAKTTITKTTDDDLREMKTISFSSNMLWQSIRLVQLINYVYLTVPHTHTQKLKQPSATAESNCSATAGCTRDDAQHTGFFGLHEYR